MLLSDASGLLARKTDADKDRSTWNFCSWTKIESAAFGGHDVIANRKIAAGEVIISELPLLHAAAPDTNEDGWASASLRAFAGASATVQARVLAISAAGDHEEAARSDGSSKEQGATAADNQKRMCAEATNEVARCADQPWRRAALPIINDEMLCRVVHIFHLNGYTYGAKSELTALFALGCQLNHSCDANVRYKMSTDASGHGCFVARRDIASGESLCTNYIGEYADIMSTPARRDALLASKLFTCRCAKCSASVDPHRHVPCPGCHKRQGAERELARQIAWDSKGHVHYARPISADPDARWLCERCPEQRWRIEQVIPGPGSAGGLEGRAWERVVERHVLHLEARAEAAFERGDGVSLEGEANEMHGLVMHSLGRRHWTTVRTAEIVAGVRAQAADGR